MHLLDATTGPRARRGFAQSCCGFPGRALRAELVCDRERLVEDGEEEVGVGLRGGSRRRRGERGTRRACGAQAVGQEGVDVGQQREMFEFV